MYVPQFIRDYSRLEKLAGIPIVGLLAVASVWVWGALGVVFLFVALVFWSLLKLLAEGATQLKAIQDLRAREAGLADLASQLDVVEVERDKLQQQLSAPSMGVANFLHALDDQAAKLEIVEKHRRLKELNEGEFVVSATSKTAAGTLVVRAHVDSTPRLALGEEAILLDQQSNRALGVGKIASNTDTMIEVEIPGDQLEMDGLGTSASELVEQHHIVLRLSGLCIEPYRQLSSEAIASINQSIRHLATAIADTLRAELKEDNEG